MYSPWARKVYPHARVRAFPALAGLSWAGEFDFLFGNVSDHICIFAVRWAMLVFVVVAWKSSAPNGRLCYG